MFGVFKSKRVLELVALIAFKKWDVKLHLKKNRIIILPKEPKFILVEFSKCEALLLNFFRELLTQYHQRDLNTLDYQRSSCVTILRTLIDD